jgi:hypothetical protein
MYGILGIHLAYYELLLPLNRTTSHFGECMEAGLHITFVYLVNPWRLALASPLQPMHHITHPTHLFLIYIYMHHANNTIIPVIVASCRKYVAYFIMISFINFCFDV